MFMRCYECSEDGVEREAVALCNHCSAGLCPSHALVIPDPVWRSEPLVKVVALPLRARLFFCGTCREAVQQTVRQGSGAQRAAG